MDKFAEKLEDRPDPWFNKPRGYLRKPDFKRDAQKRATLAAGTGRGLFDSFMPGNTFNRRYFVLDKEKKMLWYYQDENSSDSKGEVDLKEIIAVDLSHIHDAPSHSIDLISAERHYTVTADSQEIMLKWAYAIKLLLKSAASAGQSTTEKAKALATQAPKKLSLKPVEGESTEKWHRYDVVFDIPGPLYLVSRYNSIESIALIPNYSSLTIISPNRVLERHGISEQGPQWQATQQLDHCNVVRIDFRGHSRQVRTKRTYCCQRLHRWCQWN